MRGVRGLLPLLAVLVLASGCIAPHMQAAGVPENAPDNGGHGGQTWSIAVTDMDGKPIAHAAVVAYWPAVIPLKTPEERLKAAGWARDPILRNLNGTLEYVELRTDAGGFAHVQAPKGYPLTVVATAPELTEEWHMAAWPANGTSLALPLYPQHVTVTVSGQFLSLDCQLHRFGYPAHNEELLARTTHLNATLTWTNGVPQGIADFELGSYVEGPLNFDFFGPPCPDATQTVGGHLSLGPQVESVSLGRQELGIDSATWWQNSAVYLGPVAHPTMTAPLMPYTLTINATLGVAAALRAQSTAEFPSFEVVPATAEAGDDPAGLFGEPTWGKARTAVANAAPMPVAAWLAVGVLAVAATRRGAPQPEPPRHP